jgi:hypothetical protein
MSRLGIPPKLLANVGPNLSGLDRLPVLGLMTVRASSVVGTSETEGSRFRLLYSRYST